MKELLSKLWAPVARLFQSLGGLAWLFSMLVILAGANLINPLLHLLGTHADKSAVWLKLIERGLQKLLRVGGDVWNGALVESARLDDATPPDDETPAVWKHNQLAWWLLQHGVRPPELRQRIIQAVVLQRRICDLLELWEAVTPPPVVKVQRPVNPPIH